MYVIVGYLLDCCDCRLSVRSYFVHKWLSVDYYLCEYVGILGDQLCECD